MDKVIYDINKLIIEINECKKNKNYFAALAVALILPDICSKVEQKQSNSKQTYIGWCDKWLSEYLPKISLSLSSKGTWGQIIYKLRCGILHNGENDINRKEYIFFDLVDFNLYICQDNSCCEYAIRIYNKIENGEVGHSKKMEINIDFNFLINSMINGVYRFLNKNNLQSKDFPSMTISLIDN